MENKVTQVKLATPDRNSQRSYNRFTIDVFAEHPLTIQKVVDALKDEFQLEENRIETSYAKIDICPK